MGSIRSKCAIKGWFWFGSAVWAWALVWILLRFKLHFFEDNRRIDSNFCTKFSVVFTAPAPTTRNKIETSQKPPGLRPPDTRMPDVWKIMPGAIKKRAPDKVQQKEFGRKGVRRRERSELGPMALNGPSAAGQSQLDSLTSPPQSLLPRTSLGLRRSMGHLQRI